MPTVKVRGKMKKYPYTKAGRAAAARAEKGIRKKKKATRQAKRSGY